MFSVPCQLCGLLTYSPTDVVFAAGKTTNHIPFQSQQTLILLLHLAVTTRALTRWPQNQTWCYGREISQTLTLLGFHLTHASPCLSIAKLIISFSYKFFYLTTIYHRHTHQPRTTTHLRSSLMNSAPRSHIFVCQPCRNENIWLIHSQIHYT